MAENQKAQISETGSKLRQHWYFNTENQMARLELPGLLFNPSVVSDSLQSHGLQPTRLPCPWDSPGKNTGVAWLILV